jgi:hypothetical protein
VTSRSRITSSCLVEKTTVYVFVHWFWSSWWHSDRFGNHYTPLGIFHTHVPLTSFLSLMTLLKTRSDPKSLHYRRLYDDRPDPIIFMCLVSWTCKYFSRSVPRLHSIPFLYTHRHTFALVRELPEESDQFRFLHSVCLTHLKGSVGLILPRTSVMRVSVPLYYSLHTLSKGHILWVHLLCLASFQVSAHKVIVLFPLSIFFPQKGWVMYIFLYVSVA